MQLNSNPMNDENDFNPLERIKYRICCCYTFNGWWSNLSKKFVFTCLKYDIYIICKYNNTPIFECYVKMSKQSVKKFLRLMIRNKREFIFLFIYIDSDKSWSHPSDAYFP